jgi:glycosyltransferase involved in cell wall biosynthesis
MKASSKAIFHVIAQLRMGAGRVVTDMAIEQAAKLRHHVAVCVSSDTDEYWRTDPSLVSELKLHGVEVHTIGDFFHRKTDLLHKASANLRQLMVEQKRPIIVHAHTAMGAAVGSWAHPDGLVETCHGWGMGRSIEFDLQDSIAYQLCDAVLTYSRYWAERLKADMAVSNPVLISMGLRLDRLSPQRRRRGTRHPFRIGTICELTARKGVDLLLKAMPTVWNEMAEAELHITGDGDSAAFLRDLAFQIDPGLRRVTFHGAVRNPVERLEELDLFVLASRSDNLPVVLLEAMSSGLPIIATEVGGVPDLLCAAQCGLLVPPESVSDLSEGILRYARKRREELVLTGLRGEKFVRSQNNVTKTVRELEKIYKGILQNRM